jgi:outer membrane immunogenic protein
MQGARADAPAIHSGKSLRPAAVAAEPSGAAGLALERPSESDRLLFFCTIQRRPEALYCARRRLFCLRGCAGMKRLGLGLLTSALAAAASLPFAYAPLAHAADLPVAPPLAPAPVYRPALYDWTGFYVGGHVGAGILEDQFNPLAGGVVAPTGSATVSTSGVLAGGQVGFNYEFAPWVIGIEGSWTSSNVNGSQTVPTNLGAGTLEREKANPQWLAAATGRVGYAADAWLFYVKGGAAWIKDNYTQSILVSGVAASNQTMNDTRTGFTAGVGVEYGLTENFSAKAEYDFYDFGSTTYAFTATPVSVKNQLHAITFGLNYRFNWAGGRPY